MTTIAFNLNGAGIHTIRPQSSLPVITRPVSVDGSTQPGYTGVPLVELNGSTAGRNASGLTIQNGGSAVKALIINGFGEAGILLFGGSGNSIVGNYIGTNATGMAAVGNGQGIRIDSSASNLIDRATAGLGNVISGNLGPGVLINDAAASRNNVIEGNYIGTDATGSNRLGNETGLEIRAANNTIGGTTAGAGNVIAGNSIAGVVISNSGMIIQGNYIGTNAAGVGSLGNNNGVELISGDNNFVGGTTAGSANLISGNFNAGVLIASGGNIVEGNYIGTNAQGTAALPNTEGVYLSGPNNRIGGTANGARNVISGNALAGVDIVGPFGNGNQVEGNLIGTNSAGMGAVANRQGVTVIGSNNTVGGAGAGFRNIVSGNSGDGISLFGNANVVQGNFVGTNNAGSGPLGNRTGVSVFGSNNDIGGTGAGTGNLISGNAVGVSVSGSSSLVQGNFIGTNVSGKMAISNQDGVTIVGGSNITIGGMALGSRNIISGNTGNGVWVDISSSHNLVQGNYIGTDITGSAELSNHYDGVSIAGANNTVGGIGPQARNVISASYLSNVYISGSENVVQGNFVGTDATGSRILGGYGVAIGATASNVLIGGTRSGAGNLISGSPWAGIANYGIGTLIQGNYLGTDVTGTVPLSNQRYGIESGGANALIGGTIAGAGNLISGNVYAGIEGGGSFLVQGNLIGTDATGTRALGNQFGLEIQGGTIGGTFPEARNIISGNRSAGIRLLSRSLIQGNFIGTDITGTQALGNVSGIDDFFTSNNTIGGTVPGAGNVIAGNQYGVFLYGTENLVQGNEIGTDFSGMSALANRIGIWILDAQRNTIGGTTVGARNVISGNSEAGIEILGSSNTLIQGNFIGTDPSGSIAVGNLIGISNRASSNTTIGGTMEGSGNLISGNYNDGISFTFAVTENAIIQGNKIGTNSTGLSAIPNGGGGLSLVGGATNSLIGGTVAGAGNLISGNIGNGILLGSYTPGTRVEGNRIGTDLTGLEPLGNTSNGVLVDAAFNNTIGGTAVHAGNIIAFNGLNGIEVDIGTGNPILRNAIYAHDNGLGIKLVNGGNNDQEFPTVTSAFSAGGSTTIEGKLASAPSTTFAIEFFVNLACNPSGYGEGQQFLASMTVTTDTEGNAAFSLTVAISVDPGSFVSATATDPGNNTSQFSQCIEVIGPYLPGIFAPIPAKNAVLWSYLPEPAFPPLSRSEVTIFAIPPWIQGHQTPADAKQSHLPRVEQSYSLRTGHLNNRSREAVVDGIFVQELSLDGNCGL